MTDDREYLIRTLIGEAANQPDEGLAAVGHVIVNRARSGDFGGRSIRDVVLAKHQFEPWNDPKARNRMLSVSRDDPAYQRAARVADAVLSGGPDPTGGATHFLNEDIVRQRRGGSLPKWANKMSASAHRIGDHTFYGGAGVGRVAGQQGGDGITLDAVRAEIARREAKDSGGVTLEAVRAEIARREGSSPPLPEVKPRMPAGMVELPSGYVLDTKAEAEHNARGGEVLAGAAGNVLRGVPFVGEYADEAAGALDEMTGGVPGLVENRARAATDQFAADRPWTAGGLNLAGGIASTAPLAVAAAPAMLARAPASMAGKVGAGAGAGVALGAAEGAVSGYGAGETPEGRRAEAGRRGVFGAALGGAAGGAAPLAAKGFENVARFARSRPDKKVAAKLGLSPESADVVGAMLQNDGAERAAANIADAGPGGMVADAGPATAGLLDATIQAAGPGGRIARDAIGERAAEAGADIKSALDKFLGKPRGIKEAGREVAKRTSAARTKAYDAAYSAPIDYASDAGRKVEEVLSRIPPRIARKAIDGANEGMIADGLRNQQIMAEIGDDGAVVFREMPNVRQLDAVKRALGDLGAEVDIFGRPTADALRPRRLSQELRDAIKGAVPPYGRAVKLGAEKISEDRALMTGRRILQPQFSREDVADALEGASPAELRQAKVGLRRQIDEVMANVKRSIGDSNMDAREGVKAMKELSSRATREKVRVVLGDGADELMARVDRAGRAFELAARTADNSKTFARMTFADMVEQITEPGAIGTLMEGAPVKSARAIVQAMTRMTPQARREAQERIAGEIATVLTQMRGDEARSTARRILGVLEKQPATEELALRVGRIAGGSTAIGVHQSGTQLLAR